MKSTKISLLVESLLIVFVILTGCQHENVSNITDSNKTVPDYHKLFELELYSDKQTYKSTDKIKIWATIKYIGNNDQVKIWHGDPTVTFNISDGKEFNIGGIINTILTSTMLENGELYKFDYAKNGGYSNDDANADFWKKFYEEKDLYLPEGEYTIKASGAFSLTENLEESKNNLSKQINISIVN